jgi:DNA polymerase
MASYLHGVKYDDVDDTQRFHGKVIVLGCGYGMGADKFKAQVAGYGLKLTDAEAAKYVAAYRAKYPEVPKMWYACYNAAAAAIRHPGSTFMQYKCKFRVLADKYRSYMILTLPNGSTSFYINPRLESSSSHRPTILYEGVNGYTKKWDKRKKIIPGLLTENIIQFAAREFLCDDLLVLHEKGYDIVGLIHDEIPDEPLLEMAEARHAEMKKIMSTSSEWCKELPMGADGYIHTNYRKD